MEYKVGDFVRLNSGGPVMKVVAVADDGKLVQVEWKTGSTFPTASVEAACDLCRNKEDHFCTERF